MSAPTLRQEIRAAGGRFVRWYESGQDDPRCVPCFCTVASAGAYTLTLVAVMADGDRARSHEVWREHAPTHEAAHEAARDGGVVTVSGATWRQRFADYRDARAAFLAGIRDAVPLKRCRNCGAGLRGRQRKWCADSCRREYARNHEPLVRSGLHRMGGVS